MNTIEASKISQLNQIDDICGVVAGADLSAVLTPGRWSGGKLTL
jgi:hypothetical protein